MQHGSATRIAVGAVLCFGATTAWSANPGFNLAKASSSVEKRICNDAELADLDRSPATLYAS